ncbi:tetratricopeptide repeat protein [Maridesulfovibrio hydrothermalis]|uniref:Tetratricopeptide TPR_2 repeat protein n=1 Tax=Maridesulfovibrio hydrothermalis AM13 = DSM 14728 TaxID=1121451 RepID=L0RAZ7_9BACT|nr:tetratricopeptide repeat protein [Maridesulfovibrio hydrothermalis]CCO23909.1 Tetratricopeptide TPR_2 repeat protein [Maridesulfovibrio hydrothermalis AM13 = DSM 14728]
MSGRERIRGVFSSQTGATVGTGATKRQTLQKTYWYVKELDNGALEVQPLNSNHVPSGPKFTVERESFLNSYNPEPEFYTQYVLPVMTALDEKIKRGEEHRNKSESYSAEYEFNAAVDVDEDNVRANFGLGLTYLERGETGRAEGVFKRLVDLGATYEPRHKHLFNDFGISLRKNGMIEQALEYYHKAEAICDEDENLYLNIARAYYEKGDFDGCRNYLQKSLNINPDLEEAGMFWVYLQDNGYMDEADDMTEDLDVSRMKKMKTKKKTKSTPVPGLKFDF